MLTHGSLFAGIGGFDLGFGLAGIKAIWQVEIDKGCRSVLSGHFNSVVRLENVKNCGKENLSKVDVISGGFPCQDVSVAGRRAGLAGERSGLWKEFARIIDELEPRWVVIENVPGLLSSNRGKDFALVVRWLAERGYGVAWRVFDAQYFGVPQRRRRVFVVGSLGDGRSAQVLFERECSERNTQTSRKEGQGIASPIKAGTPSRRNGGSNPTPEEFVIVPEIARPLVSGSTTDHYDESQQTYVANSITGNPANRLSAEDNYMIVEQNNKVSTPDMISLRADPAQPLIVGPLMAHSKRHGHSMTTQQAAQSGHLIVGNILGVRRLTPTEAERLQGFPDDWTAGQSNSARYRQLGNAVCVPVVEWIARRIVAVCTEDKPT